MKYNLLFLYLDVENCKACVAAITYILKNATCHAVSQNYLSNELQQVYYKIINLHSNIIIYCAIDYINS